MDEAPTPGPGGPPGGPDPYPPYGMINGLTAEDRNWASAAHLSSLLGAYAGLGFVGPLVVLLTVGTRSAFVRRHAVEALNFNLTVLLAVIASSVLGSVLISVLIGVPLLLVIGLGYLAGTVAGALAAGRGGEFRYPLTIRIVS